MATIKLASNTFSSNSAKNSNKITIRIFGGVVNGNVGEPSEVTGCDIQLSFECDDNSQYIPVV